MIAKWRINFANLARAIFNNISIESTLKTGDFHKMNYFGWNFYFLKFSDALVSVN